MPSTPERSTGTTRCTRRLSFLTSSSKLPGRCRSRTCIGSCRPSPLTRKVSFDGFYSSSVMCTDVRLTSKRPQWCRIPLSRSHRPGDLLRHEHPDHNLPADRLVSSYTASKVSGHHINIDSCVTFGLMAACVGPMIVLVNSTPDKIPADLILEGQEKEKLEKLSVIEPSKV